MRITVASCMNRHSVNVSENGTRPERESLTGSAKMPVPKMVATATNVALISANVSFGKLNAWRHSVWWQQGEDERV